MNQIIRIGIVFFLIISSIFADTLEIKVNQSSIKLPYWPAQDPHYGGVLIVRGGEPVQWSDFLADFARQLAESGWSTVLLNCNMDSTVPWLTQLPEAMNALRQDKNNRIVLIHYGEQLNMTLDYFSKPQTKAVNALVMLSAYDVQDGSDKPPNGSDKQPNSSKPNSLDKPPSFRFPILDIVGQFDYTMVLNQSEARESKFKSPGYLPLKIAGAPHDYEYYEKIVLAFLEGWMMKLPEATPQAPPIPKSGAGLNYKRPLFNVLSYYLQWRYPSLYDGRRHLSSNTVNVNS